MKICTLIFSVIIILSVACQKDVSMNLPTPSSKYSEDQVDSILEITTCITGIAVQNPVEQIVSKQFLKNFPGAYNVNWILQQDFYRVDFDVDYIKYEAIYDNLGLLIVSMIAIEKSQIPKSISSVGKDRYGQAWNIAQAFYAKSAYETGFYKLQLEKDDGLVITFFHSNGDFMLDCP